MDTPVWSNIETSLRECRWTHSAVAVMAIPHWKIFVFGGKTGQINEDDKQGAYSDDLAILDTGSHRWYYPQLAGALPAPRSDMAMEFESKTSKLVMFGGWQGEWLQDLHTLDVSSIVGPPYAVTDVYPSMGPITGGTALEVLGIDFVQGPVTVRFASRKGFVDVKVDVRVALGEDSFTTTFARFTYFPVTAARFTLMYGPGLLQGGAANEEAMFYIQARTQDNANRTTGGDEFKVSIIQLAQGDDGKEVPLAGVSVSEHGMIPLFRFPCVHA
jgi:dynein heavy chain, axonemal